MKRHVYIATPVHGGEVPCEYVRSLVMTQTAMSLNGIDMTHSFLVGNALVHDARNRLAQWAMEVPEVTDVLFIDGDIQWDPNDAVRLVNSPHAVIGGAYRKKMPKIEFNVRGAKRGVTKLCEVEHLGMGFCKISRVCIKRLQEAFPETLYKDRDGNAVYGLFQSPIEGGEITGEDVFFFRRWRGLGGKVFLDPDITLGHVGRHIFVGNFAADCVEAQDGLEQPVS